jgi:hypothetical protein
LIASSVMPTVLPAPVAPLLVAVASGAGLEVLSSSDDWLVQAPITSPAVATRAATLRTLIIVFPPDPTSSELSNEDPKNRW